MKTTLHKIEPSVNGNNSLSNPYFFQPKLSVNSPGDVYEQQADAMAAQVMRMQIPQKKDAFFSPAIQRKCAACEEEDKHIHRKENSNSEAQGSNELDNYVSSLSSSGQPLPESSRQFFEPRFGQDFSTVKIHTDSVAAKSAQSINALAYTTGNNIVFNEGQYSPDSESGQRLMAHELTHVVQQSNQPTSVQRTPGSLYKTVEQLFIDAANKQRLSNLNFAYWNLNGLDMALNDPAYDKNNLNRDYGKTLSALATWVKIQPNDANFRDNLKKVNSLIWRNYALGTTPSSYYQTDEGPRDIYGKVSCSTPAYAWSYISHPEAGVACCSLFMHSGPLCRTDVLTHEHFHLVGLNHGGDKARALMTTAECMDSADNIAQLVSALNGITTDNCPAGK